MIEVIINREKFMVSADGSLADILPLLRIDKPDGLAIAVNDTIIPRTDWPGYRLQAQDRIFVIRATQGG